MGFFDKRLLKKYWKEADKVIAYESAMAALTDDELRGFNHVVEVCKQIGININPVIEKTSHFKQAENTAKQRQQIGKHLQLKATDKLHNKRVLIVDDIYTTGSTMKAAIKLVEQLQPKEIRILVLAKTKDRDDKKSNTKHSLH